MRSLFFLTMFCFLLMAVSCGGSGGTSGTGGGGGGPAVINYRTLDLTTGAVTTSTSLPNVTSVAATSTLMVFRRIPAGSVTLGQATSTLGAQADELPSGSAAAVSEFWLAVFEFTQGQWISLTGDSVTVPWKQVAPTGVVGSTETVAAKPVFGVTHDEVVAKLVTWNTGRSVSLRLPTAQEWEYACRGGSTTLFSWGDSIDPAVAGQFAVSNDTTQGVNGPAFVGLGRTSNGLNLWDMHGNVREWVTTGNPSFPELRGGSWGDNLLQSRSANHVTSVDKGFRHALSGARLVLIP
jgi:formylglycine-generating enzyme required for sulfatase activity